MQRTIVSFSLIVLIAGCGEVDSSELATDAIDATITIGASERWETEAVVLLSAGLDDVVLTGGDRLTLTTDLDPERDFVRQEGLADTYRAPFDDDASEATVALLREGEASASSTVSIPPRLDLDVPLEGATLSLAEGPRTVAWNNPLSEARIDVWTIACGATGGGLGLYPEDPPDEGSLILDPAELGAPGDCVSVVITRSVEGATDPALHEDSSITGKRDEQFDVTLAP